LPVIAIMNIRTASRFVTAYARTRLLERTRSRARIERQQHRWLTDLLRDVGQGSPFYREYAARSFADWPVIDKQIWMDRFDDINTVGAKRGDILEIASRAETTRNFSATWNGFTVGLSSGTSGARGLFMASPAERAQWAGTLLAKLMKGSILRHERIALVLRAGSTLYESVQALRLRFAFIDQTWAWPRIVESLLQSNPTILAAPARVLRLLADQCVPLRPRRIISVAEVLDELDRRQIEDRYRLKVEQIYQATEGLLGISCEHGLIHLNEPFILVEPEWQDAAHTRMIPVVTDLKRRSQPVIRYRLNDVLRVANAPCTCGRASLALAGVDGRCDDVLWLNGADALIPVFPDVLARTILRAVEDLLDFEVQEIAPGHWRLGLAPPPSPAVGARLMQDCAAMVRTLSAEPPRMDITGIQPLPFAQKQRRIRGSRSFPCAS
jgi:putative adenylate-forming enzyme